MLASIVMWAFPLAVAIIATLAAAFGTPLIALSIFAASVAASIGHQRRRIVLDGFPQTRLKPCDKLAIPREKMKCGLAAWRPGLRSTERPLPRLIFRKCVDCRIV